MQAIYEEKLAYATKARDYANNELEEMRWSIEKSAEQAEKQGQRLKETNAEILRLS